MVFKIESRQSVKHNNMSTTAVPQSVLYFNYAVMYNIDKMQQNADQNIAVRYPPNTYVDFGSYTRDKGEVKKDSSKAKILTAEPAAVEFIKNMFNIVGDRVMYFGANHKSLDEFAAADSAASVMNDYKNAEIDAAFLTPEVKDVINQLESSYNTKVLPNKPEDSFKSISKGMFKGFLRLLYTASAYVAATVIFSTAKTTSKYTDAALKSAILTNYESDNKDHVYKLLSYCGSVITSKEVHVVAKKPATGTSKPAGSRSKPQASNTKENISDDEDDAEKKAAKETKATKTKKGRGAKPKQPVVEESDEDESGSDSSDSEVDEK